MKQGARLPSLRQYLRSLGLETATAKATRQGQEAAERQSQAAAAAVREAFKSRGVTKTSG